MEHYFIFCEHFIPFFAFRIYEYITVNLVFIDNTAMIVWIGIERHIHGTPFCNITP